ncbi:MAG: glycosyltransferase family 9 protein [Elusimicrobiota bacterium]|jgi:heptosyltransferase-2|nr:glycosyltransferase family 9 protein [Elusimicrobiota bacterium]
MSNKTDSWHILIIKLGAMGDVLRTTFLLEGLKDIYPKSSISWIVAKNNACVLQNNHFIDEIIPSDDKTNSFLTTHFFDIVINLDLAPESLSLAKLANTRKVCGYVVDNLRQVIPSNDFADKWLSMSAYDELKKANQNTYQFWMSKIVGIPKADYEINVPLTKDSMEKADKFFKNLNVKTDKKIIGINPGAGKRWKMKKWTTEGFIETARAFSKKGHIILLLGGNDDRDEIENILSAKIPNVFSTGLDNSIADFFAMINLCDVILCGDTMALHAALGLKKNVVVIFGPTSAAEIEVYGRGSKIFADKKCLCCYKPNCDKKETCMDAVKTETVIKTMERYL